MMLDLYNENIKVTHMKFIPWIIHSRFGLIKLRTKINHSEKFLSERERCSQALYSVFGIYGFLQLEP